MSLVAGAAMIAPPTGTMKFLSVDWMNASTRPRRQAAVTRAHSSEDCTPYALLTICAIPNPSQSFACRDTFSNLSKYSHSLPVQVGFEFNNHKSLQTCSSKMPSATAHHIAAQSTVLRAGSWQQYDLLMQLWAQ